jgi:hypothetical protein
MTKFNTDLTDAPRDKSLILAVHKSRNVVQSYWIPPRHTATGKLLEGNRWSGFNLGEDPIAWAPWPTYEPGAVVQPMGVDTAGIEFMSACDSVGGI